MLLVVLVPERVNHLHQLRLNIFVSTGRRQRWKKQKNKCTNPHETKTTLQWRPKETETKTNSSRKEEHQHFIKKNKKRSQQQALSASAESTKRAERRRRKLYGPCRLAAVLSSVFRSEQNEEMENESATDASSYTERIYTSRFAGLENEVWSKSPLLE